MTEATPKRIIRGPNDEEARAAFDAYCLGVGKVAHAWNYLQENLGQLFVFVTGGAPAIMLSVWYSARSDQTQRNMLRAALLAIKDDRWQPRLPTARDDLVWIVDEANALAEHRNNAIHMPGTLLTGADGTAIGPSIAAYINGNPLARRVWGKQLLPEFDLSEKCAEALSRFTRHACVSLMDHELPWPKRPSLPIRRQKSTPPNRPRQPRIRSRARLPRSSPE
jgi:hypothetical protein